MFHIIAYNHKITVDRIMRNISVNIHVNIIYNFMRYCMKIISLQSVVLGRKYLIKIVQL